MNLNASRESVSLCGGSEGGAVEAAGVGVGVEDGERGQRLFDQHRMHSRRGGLRGREPRDCRRTTHCILGVLLVEEGKGCEKTAFLVRAAVTLGDKEKEPAMSQKRAADTYLTDRNAHEADENDSVAPVGEFKKASEDVLRQRVILGPRRRARPEADGASAAQPFPQSSPAPFSGFSFGTPLASTEGGSSSAAATFVFSKQTSAPAPIDSATEIKPSPPAFAAFSFAPKRVDDAPKAHPPAFSNTIAFGASKSHDSLSVPSPAGTASGSKDLFTFGSIKENNDGNSTATPKTIPFNFVATNKVETDLSEPPRPSLFGASASSWTPSWKSVETPFSTRLEEEKPKKGADDGKEKLVEFARQQRGLNCSFKKSIIEKSEAAKLAKSYGRTESEVTIVDISARANATNERLDTTAAELTKPIAIGQTQKEAQPSSNLFGALGSGAAKKEEFNFSFSSSSSAALPPPPFSSTAAPPITFGAKATGEAPQPLFGNAANPALFAKQPTQQEDQEQAGSDEEESKDEQIDTEKLMKGAGEENEETVCLANVKAFNFSSETKGWSHIGVGLVKLNQDKTSGKARLLLRADGSGRVLLNTMILPVMAPKLDNPKNLSFLSVGADGKPTRMLFKIKDTKEAEKFFDSLKNLVERTKSESTGK
ncbi:hypothetical protein DFJ73DRAFT_959886 [Zopfochytrium polystomum]|nr:hypothetical protein DFJ73DRAFT_959886 [Zopfochytrium polystomum]